MKKFKVIVTRTVEYEVIVDETVWNDVYRKSWERTFWDLPEGFEGTDNDPDVEAAAGFAQALAESSIRLGVNGFIEGFGMCAPDKMRADRWNGKKHPNNEELYTEGLYIQELDDYTESEIKAKDL